MSRDSSVRDGFYTRRSKVQTHSRVSDNHHASGSEENTTMILGCCYFSAKTLMQMSVCFQSTHGSQSTGLSNTLINRILGSWQTTRVQQTPHYFLFCSGKSLTSRWNACTVRDLRGQNQKLCFLKHNIVFWMCPAQWERDLILKFQLLYGSVEALECFRLYL